MFSMTAAWGYGNGGGIICAIPVDYRSITRTLQSPQIFYCKPYENVIIAGGILQITLSVAHQDGVRHE